MGPLTILMMSAFFKTGIISMAASRWSVIRSRSDSKSSFPKPRETDLCGQNVVCKKVSKGRDLCNRGL